MRASAPILHPAGLRRRQIDVHVDVGDVEHREDLAARGKHLADVGDAVLDAALSRRDERIVGDVDLIEFDIVGRGIERPLGLADATALPLQRGIGAIERCRRWSSSSLVAKPFAPA